MNYSVYDHVIQRIMVVINKVIPYLILFVFFIYGCSSDEMSISSFKGSWIETTTFQDTLIFHGDELDGMLTLNRPKENRNGYILPMAGAGIYMYEIEKDSIKLQNAILSCLCTTSHPIHLLKDGDMLAIGNFYNDDLKPEDILIFRRL